MTDKDTQTLKNIVQFKNDPEYQEIMEALSDLTDPCSCPDESHSRTVTSHRSKTTKPSKKSNASSLLNAQDRRPPPGPSTSTHETTHAIRPEPETSTQPSAYAEIKSLPERIQAWKKAFPNTKVYPYFTEKYDSIDISIIDSCIEDLEKCTSLEEAEVKDRDWSFIMKGAYMQSNCTERDVGKLMLSNMKKVLSQFADQLVTSNDYVKTNMSNTLAAQKEFSKLIDNVNRATNEVRDLIPVIKQSLPTKPLLIVPEIPKPSHQKTISFFISKHPCSIIISGPTRILKLDSSVEAALENVNSPFKTWIQIMPPHHLDLLSSLEIGPILKELRTSGKKELNDFMKMLLNIN